MDPILYPLTLLRQEGADVCGTVQRPVVTVGGHSAHVGTFEHGVVAYRLNMPLVQHVVVTEGSVPSAQEQLAIWNNQEIH